MVALGRCNNKQNGRSGRPFCGEVSVGYSVFCWYSWCCFRSFRWLTSAVSEAVCTEHARRLWFERNLAFLAAGRANNAVHFLWTSVRSCSSWFATTITLIAAFLATLWATSRRLIEPLLRKKFLLPCRPRELGSTVPTGQGFILVHTPFRNYNVWYIHCTGLQK